MSCDLCNDWQHLQCHANADAAAGRLNVDYDQIDFVCSRCRSDPSRNRRTRRQPPPTPRNSNGVDLLTTPVVKEKRKYKPRAPKIYLDEDGVPLPPGIKPPKPVKAPRLVRFFSIGTCPIDQMLALLLTLSMPINSLQKVLPGLPN
jgi:hypothetical protein